MLNSMLYIAIGLPPCPKSNIRTGWFWVRWVLPFFFKNSRLQVIPPFFLNRETFQWFMPSLPGRNIDDRVPLVTNKRSTVELKSMVLHGDRLWTGFSMGLWSSSGGLSGHYEKPAGMMQKVRITSPAFTKECFPNSPFQPLKGLQFDEPLNRTWPAFWHCNVKPEARTLVFE